MVAGGQRLAMASDTPFIINKLSKIELLLFGELAVSRTSLGTGLV